MREPTAPIVLKEGNMMSKTLGTLILTVMAWLPVHTYAADIARTAIHSETDTAVTLTKAQPYQGRGLNDKRQECNCHCTPQGILLLQCGTDEENLGNYGNLENCNLWMKKHSKCN